ncbi:hypothetical protein P9250_22570 [Caballeronia sp. LP006]|uniref:hypothetical protein n=1 Tax=unclassified Caballeronia TaxID=2646786 RepID=UPI002027B230|nr:MULTISPECIES: hypothetical protein [unclassified Caballeronia]MDR5830661.1 hypothetical protein [Caballeronia sp. LP006]
MVAIDAYCTTNGINFWPELALWWMPQVLALGTALLFRPPIELLGGVALAYGTFTAIAHVWSTFTLGWAGYLVCMFGACTGIVIAAFRNLPRITPHPAIAARDGFCFAGLGIALNVLVLHVLFH